MSLVKMAFMLALAMVAGQVQPPKNDPNGIWESETGTRFEMRLSGDDLRIQLVEGSNPAFLKYDVNLKNTGEKNTYAGAGSFVAKMKTGKECTFATRWQLIVVQAEMIVGSTTSVIPNPETCEVTESGESMIILKKK